MKLFKAPAIKTMKARLKELTDVGIKRNQQEFALWCNYCDYLYFPIREWPRLCTGCKRHIKDGYNRVNKDGRIIIHFKGQKTLKEAFAD